MFKDNLFQKIEQKTNIKKETILELAKKLQNNNLDKEESIREIIHDLSNLTGKEVSKEKEEKIIDAIKNDKVPKNVDTLFEKKL
ncbi:MAG: stage VI sporulation protein F [Bacilli bacterium]|nr:stage VI sporulation protein F [Bacilli bacterium]MBR2998107.1 stage VI sporulation protein F [Bacilli bacterium]